MHWRTYVRMTSEYNAFALAAFAGMAARLGLVERRLVGVRDALRGVE